MWFHDTKKKGERTLKKEGNSAPIVTQIVEHQGVEELHKNDAVLRFWLPEEAKQALDEVVQCNQTTASRYLRELFVVYLYGEHELQRMRQQATGLYYIPPPPEQMEMKEEEPVYPEVRDSIEKATTVTVVSELGKSIVPIKLHLSRKIKEGLQAVADKAEMPLSTFVREVLISHLFGHTYWQERIRSWTLEEEDIATRWEEDHEQSIVNIDKYEWGKQ